MSPHWTGDKIPSSIRAWAGKPQAAPVLEPRMRLYPRVGGEARPSDGARAVEEERGREVAVLLRAERGPRLLPDVEPGVDPAPRIEAKVREPAVRGRLSRERLRRGLGPVVPVHTQGQRLGVDLGGESCRVADDLAPAVHPPEYAARTGRGMTSVKTGASGSAALTLIGRMNVWVTTSPAAPESRAICATTEESADDWAYGNWATGRVVFTGTAFRHVSIGADSAPGGAGSCHKIDEASAMGLNAPRRTVEPGN